MKNTKNMVTKTSFLTLQMKTLYFGLIGTMTKVAGFSIFLTGNHLGSCVFSNTKVHTRIWVWDPSQYTSCQTAGLRRPGSMSTWHWLQVLHSHVTLLNLVKHARLHSRMRISNNNNTSDCKNSNYQRRS